MQKRLLAYINAENGIKDNLIETAALYENLGMDGLFVYNHSENETEREEFLLLVKDMARVVDIPIIIGSRVGRFEDVKKAFYTGAVAVSILLGDIKDILLSGKSHLVVELIELAGRTVGSCVLVAEAGSDLEVFIEARHHKELLEDLRSLRQSVELALVPAAGDQIVARALG